jgi:hypothetical protein
MVNVDCIGGFRFQVDILSISILYEEPFNKICTSTIWASSENQSYTGPIRTKMQFGHQFVL